MGGRTGPRRDSRRARRDAPASPPGTTPEPRDDVETTLAAPGLPAVPPSGGGGSTFLSPLPLPLIDGRKAGGSGTPLPPALEKEGARPCAAGRTKRSATLPPGGLLRRSPSPALRLPGARARVGTKSGPESSVKKPEERRDSTSASSKVGLVRYVVLRVSVPAGCGTGAKVCVCVGRAGREGAGGVPRRALSVSRWAVRGLGGRCAPKSR